MAKTVNFKIQLEVDGQQRVVNATADIGNLKKELGAAEKSVSRFTDEFAHMANVSMTIDGLTNTIGQMQRGLQEMSNAYAVQEQNEKRLETVMRERMDASAADIQQMKELASAQQEIGVIGDEVQLAGMQQVSTFLHEKEALEQLVPVMNNLIAQQNGLNATQQDAQSIGNLLGKAMQGQTEALQRVGISFSEAQKEVMQTGTEMERASMLAEIITQNVGNMNEELRNTPTGELKALDNTIGDVKESVGQLVQGIMPYLTIASNLTIAASGALKMATAVKSLGVAHGLASAGAVAHNLQLKLMTAMMRQGIATATGLRLALQALKVASIIGIALAALTEAVIYFTGKSEEATDAAEDLADGIDDIKEAEQSYTHAAADAKVAMDKEISSLNDLINSHKDTTAAVNHLNEEYGTVFGNHQTAAEWYDVLIKKSKDYCAMLGYEAQMKVLASKKAAAEIELDKMRRDLLSFGGEHTRGNYSQEDAKKLEKMTSAVEKQEGKVKSLAEDWDTASKKMSEAAANLGGSGTPKGKGVRPSRNTRKTEKSPLEKVKEQTAKTDYGQFATARQNREEEIEVPLVSKPEKSLEQIRAELFGGPLPVEVEPETREKQKFIDGLFDKKEKIQLDFEAGKISEKDAEQQMNQLQQMFRDLGIDIPVNLDTSNVDTDFTKNLSSAFDGLTGVMQAFNQEVDVSVAGIMKWASQTLSSVASCVAAFIALAGAKSAASAAETPIVGWIMAAGAAVGVMASLASICAFADGGLVSGPTLGLIGEYPGARSNPEVIAPLDKLKSMIKPQQVAMVPGTIFGRIRGRDIVLVAGNESQIGAKSGRRTRILG